MGWLSLEGIRRNLWTHRPLICFMSISFETVLFDGQQTWLGGNPSCSSWMFHQLPCWLPECPFSSFPDQSPPIEKMEMIPDQTSHHAAFCSQGYGLNGIRLPHPSPGSYILKKIRVKSGLVIANPWLLRDLPACRSPSHTTGPEGSVRNDRKDQLEGMMGRDKG